MTPTPISPRALRIAIVLAVMFDVFAILLMVHTTPIMFTLFMFLGQPLFAMAVLCLLAAQLIELRTRGLL